MTIHANKSRLIFKLLHFKNGRKRKCIPRHKTYKTTLEIENQIIQQVTGFNYSWYKIYLKTEDTERKFIQF